jgi:hypothetical protein
MLRGMGWHADLDLYEKLLSRPFVPSMLIVSAQSKEGRFVLENQEGELYFDGFIHAFVKCGECTVLVPLSEVPST